MSDPCGKVLPMARRLVTSHGAHARLEAARAFLRERRPQERLLIVGATLDGASELLRTSGTEATFGWERLTLGRLAARIAQERLEARGLATLSALGLEAVCARVVHALRQASALGRYQPVASQPGLPRALAATLSELRLAGVRPEGDLGRIHDAYLEELARARLADRAEVFGLAVEGGKSDLLLLPAVLVDVPVRTALEERFVALLRGEVLATAVEGDETTVKRISRAFAVAPERLDPEPRTAVERVQRRLFLEETAAPSEPSDEVVVFSAPGESRECVEVVRRILDEARGGLPFDRMAVLLRAPAQVRALFEEAFARAGIPAFFAQGTVRPDPAGRAFLALLACASDGLSARRFAEYLSLGEVPDADRGAPPEPAPRGERWVPPDSDLFADGAMPPEEKPPEPPRDLDAPVVAGTLRAPWRWERLILDAAVIGGKDRWRRRLEGLGAKLAARAAAEEDEGRAARLRSDASDLATLSGFALPLLETLASLPVGARWGEWLDALSALATRALRDPARVLAVLAELQPMAPVGPVGLDEVRLVLSRRLSELSFPPSGRRYGRVFVAPVAAARGLSFEVVFIPGLAEKMFPQKVLQDPILRDAERRGLAGLTTSEDRIAAERLALRLAAGAAVRKLVLSWPRLDAQQARARVPSFYGLEVLRAAEGTLPGFTTLMRRAEAAGGARIGWPAPALATAAIDEAEHDLALLGGAFHLSPEENRGVAHYLLGANPHLGRALRSRARRWLKRWTPADGFVEPAADALAALSAHSLRSRSYSPTALQNFAACPYRFFLQAVHKLAPREVPEAIDELDPLSRGSLIHQVQFELLRELQEEKLLPLDAASLGPAQARLEEVLTRVAGDFADQLHPAIDRVWNDGIVGIANDLREWLRREAEEREWEPWRFELSFGLHGQEGRDPHSSKEPVALDAGIGLRGSIDLVERRADGALRATDYKSGRVRAKDGVVVGGGATLQPALYALALEKLFPGAHVEEGRLWYCTYAGDFTTVPVALDDAAREGVRAVAQTVGDALQRGFLPAAPAERECTYCDYLPVCGPAEEMRTRRKPKDALGPLVQLRGMQ